MKTIVLGFSDDTGKGAATLVCGPDADASEQIKLVHDAKSHQKFPKGIVRLEMCTFQAKTVAIELQKQTNSKKEKD